jgi:hypothetical protein
MTLGAVYVEGGWKMVSGPKSRLARGVAWATEAKSKARAVSNIAGRGESQVMSTVSTVQGLLYFKVDHLSRRCPTPSRRFAEQPPHDLVPSRTIRSTEDDPEHLVTC